MKRFPLPTLSVLLRQTLLKVVWPLRLARDSFKTPDLRWSTQYIHSNLVLYPETPSRFETIDLFSVELANPHLLTSTRCFALACGGRCGEPEGRLSEWTVCR